VEIAEPTATAIVLLVGGLLLGASALSSRLASGSGVPLALIFLVIGMLAGSEGLGGIAFEDYHFTYRAGTMALVLILFDGGLNTPFTSLRRSLKPAAVLATLGVVLTALLMALMAVAFGMPWNIALLLGAVVSSTDAAAVFGVLRGSGISLRKRTGTTLELESGLNDPMAVILTMACTMAVANDSPLGWGVLGQTLVQLVVGTAGGLALGYGSRWLLERVRFITAGLYPVLSTALALLAFAVPSLMAGSGFLAVYVAAVIIGNAHVPHARSMRRVHDTLAWFSQVTLFLLMGLLAFPSRLLEVAGTGLCLALFLAVVARPLAVVCCLLPFRYNLRDTGYIAWVGLRGAVPILLATFPIMHQVPGAERIFDLVFFIVVINAILPGMTVKWLTSRLGLEAPTPPPPPAVLEVDAHHRLDKHLLSFFIREQSPVAHTAIADIPFPEEAMAMVVVRGTRLIPPKGRTVLEPGDHVFVLFDERDRALLHLLFGSPEEED
jgi:cell volume regulation protein A